MSRLDSDVKYLVIAIATIFIDRLTKIAALSFLDQPLRMNSFLEFQLVFNRGVSWGLFHSDYGYTFLLVTLLISVIIVLLFCYSIVRYLNQHPIYGEVLVLAGALSNLVDRCLYGGVIDFIHLSYDTWSWPIFNIADVAIVLGVVWILIHYREL